MDCPPHATFSSASGQAPLCRFASKLWQTVAFSVAPSQSPSACFCPSAAIPQRHDQAVVTDRVLPQAAQRGVRYALLAVRAAYAPSTLPAGSGGAGRLCWYARSAGTSVVTPPSFCQAPRRVNRFWSADSPDIRAHVAGRVVDPIRVDARQTMERRPPISPTTNNTTAMTSST